MEQMTVEPLKLLMSVSAWARQRLPSLHRSRARFKTSGALLLFWEKVVVQWLQVSRRSSLSSYTVWSSFSLSFSSTVLIQTSRTISFCTSIWLLSCRFLFSRPGLAPTRNYQSTCRQQRCFTYLFWFQLQSQLRFSFPFRFTGSWMLSNNPGTSPLITMGEIL